MFWVPTISSQTRETWLRSTRQQFIIKITDKGEVEVGWEENKLRNWSTLAQLVPVNCIKNVTEALKMPGLYILITLSQLCDEEGNVDRQEFIDYARKSSSVKELTDKLSSAGKTLPSSSKPKVSLDKAELAFKVYKRPE